MDERRVAAPDLSVALRPPADCSARWMIQGDALQTPEPASAPLAPRRPRRCVVALAGNPRTGDRAARALAESLRGLGIETKYLGKEDSAHRIALAVADERADAVELCLGGGGVMLLRELLRELARIGRRDVSIVVHRIH